MSTKTEFKKQVTDRNFKFKKFKFCEQLTASAKTTVWERKGKLRTKRCGKMKRRTKRRKRVHESGWK